MIKSEHGRRPLPKQYECPAGGRALSCRGQRGLAWMLGLGVWHAARTSEEERLLAPKAVPAV